MKYSIKWRPIYGGLGEWIRFDGGLLYLKGNFAATHDGRKILVVMSTHYSPAGHGEGSFNYEKPNYIDAVTLETLKLDNPILEVSLNETPVDPDTALKKYLLFASMQFYPGGAFSDFEGSFDTAAEAVAFVKAELAKEDSSWNHYTWIELVNSNTGKAVRVQDSTKRPFSNPKTEWPELLNL